MQIDLAAQGVADFGTFVSRGFGRDAGPSHLELFFDDLPMTVAQWPNAGQFATITGFTYDGERPSCWAPADDIWVHGYWGYDCASPAAPSATAVPGPCRSRAAPTTPWPGATSMAAATAASTSTTATAPL